MGRPVSEGIPNEVGLRIQQIREAAGIGRAPLSEAAGFSPAVVYHLETGLIDKPSAELVFAIASALGTTADYIFLGKGKAPRVEQTQAAFIRASEKNLRKAG